MLARFRPGFFALALAALVGACGADSSTAPNTTPATLDQALAELSIPAVSSASGALFDAGVTAPALLPSRCPYAAASQSFVCTPFSASGVTIDQTFTLLTASGAHQAAFDAATTAAVRVNTTVAGTVTGGGTNLTVAGQQQLTLSGLISGLHTLNGNSTTSLSGTIADGTTSFPIDVTVTTAITNLVLPSNTTPGTPIWPTSGTVTVQASGTVAGVPTGTQKVAMIFNGTSIVDVTVTGSGVSKSCKVDLSKTTEPSCP
jgi:hypothetical protein